MIRTGKAAALSPLTLAVVVSALVAGACDDDGKTAPALCADPPLPLYDISAGAPAEAGDQVNPCVTPVGDAYSAPADAELGGSSGVQPPGASSGGAAASANDAGAGGA